MFCSFLDVRSTCCQQDADLTVVQRDFMEALLKVGVEDGAGNDLLDRGPKVLTPWTQWTSSYLGCPRYPKQESVPAQKVARVRHYLGD